LLPITFVVGLEPLLTLSTLSSTLSITLSNIIRKRVLWHFAGVNLNLR
jgi:hypothetical protein